MVQDDRNFENLGRNDKTKKWEELKTPEVHKTRFKLDSKERYFLLPSETFLTDQDWNLSWRQRGLQKKNSFFFTNNCLPKAP